jgi:hypothetical protein
MEQIGDQLRKHPEQRLPLSALDPLSKIVHGNNIVLYVCNKMPNMAAFGRDNYPPLLLIAENSGQVVASRRLPDIQTMQISAGQKYLSQ